MARFGDLEASGLLYGSNYAAWRKRMDAKLRMHSLYPFVTQDRCPQDERFTETEWTKQSHIAANIICVEIAPDLFLRVPKNEIKDAKCLMSRLEELTTRFRFLDLPVELRNRIYEYIIDSEDRKDVWPRCGVQSKYPAITRASKQLRQESLPLMYSRTTFYFDFTQTPDGGSTELTIPAAIELWAKKQSESHLRFLRKISITTDFHSLSSSGSPRPKTITLSFSKAAGFSAKEEVAGFTKPSQRMFEDHVTMMQSISNMCSMQGEILVVTLVCNPGLWKNLWIKQ